MCSLCFPEHSTKAQPHSLANFCPSSIVTLLSRSQISHVNEIIAHSPIAKEIGLVTDYDSRNSVHAECIENLVVYRLDHIERFT